MKKNVLIILFIGICIITGCATTASLQDRLLSENELAVMEIIGNVQTNFEIANYALGLIVQPSEERIKNTAYEKLLEEAKLNYAGNIDIQNINIYFDKRKRRWLPFVGFWGVFIYNASGDVIVSME